MSVLEQLEGEELQKFLRLNVVLKTVWERLDRDHKPADMELYFVDGTHVPHQVAFVMFDPQSGGIQRSLGPESGGDVRTSPRRLVTHRRQRLV